MSRQNRTTLKSYFSTGTRPTQEHFADLIDSNLNLMDDGTFYWGASLGLGHSNPSSTLSVQGNASISPDNDSAPGNGLFVHGNVGIGAGFTSPTAQLAVKGSVYIGNTQSTDPGANSLKVDGNITTEGNLSINGTLDAGSDTTIDGNLTLAGTRHLAADEVRARNSGGLKLYDASGADGLMIHDNGNISIGSDDAETHKLHVTGSLRVTSHAHIDRDLTVTGNIQTPKLILGGPVGKTEFLVITGEEGEDGIIDIPPDKFVVGLAVKRLGDDENNLYSFALIYK